MMEGTLFLLTGGSGPVLGAQPGTPAPAAPAGAAAVTETPAQAPGAAAQGDGGMDMFLLFGIWALIIVGFYFLTIRPQRKKDKAIKEMQSTLKVGDNVVVSGGMFGRIAEVGHDCFLIEFGINKGVRIPVRKFDVLGIQTPQLTPPAKEE